MRLLTLFPRRGQPSPIVIHIHMGQENPVMPPVSQDVSDFCASIGPAVSSYTQAQVDAALAKAATDAAAAAQAATDKAVSDALAQVTQDHADEVAALKDALAKATAPPA